MNPNEGGICEPVGVAETSLDGLKDGVCSSVVRSPTVAKLSPAQFGKKTKEYEKIGKLVRQVLEHFFESREAREART